LLINASFGEVYLEGNKIIVTVTGKEGEQAEKARVDAKPLGCPLHSGRWLCSHLWMIVILQLFVLICFQVKS
jgi:hypothetical protein